MSLSARQRAGRGGLPQPGDLVELSVGEVAHGGWCVARPASGPVIFVRHALPGEQVRAVITQVTSRFARADATAILEASADRVEPPCPHAYPGGCGGCDWQHARLPAQRDLKAAVVRQQLRRIAGIERDVTVEPVPGDQDGLGWRTRVKFAVGQDGLAGLRRHRSHEVMPISDCPIAHPLVEAAAVTGRRWPGAVFVEIAIAPGSGQRAVIVAGDATEPGIAADTVLPGCPARPGARCAVATVTCANVLPGGPGGSARPVSGRYIRARRTRSRPPCSMPCARSRGRWRSTCTAAPGCSPGSWPRPSARPAR